MVVMHPLLQLVSLPHVPCFLFYYYCYFTNSQFYIHICLKYSIILIYLYGAFFLNCMYNLEYSPHNWFTGYAIFPHSRVSSYHFFSNTVSTRTRIPTLMLDQNFTCEILLVELCSVANSFFFNF